MIKWTKIPCPGCDGHGMVSDYGYFGEDFYGAKECDDCHGTGRWWKTENGTCALYPGGPFRGRDRNEAH
jgi:DnaJ-class molecular chaperone